MEDELLVHLCELARLRLTEAERASFAAKFAQVLAFVEEIKALQLDVEGVPPPVMKERQEAAEDAARESEPSPELPCDYRVGAIGDLEGWEDA